MQFKLAYLAIIEIGRKGYMLQIYDNVEEAEVLIHEYMNLSAKYWPNELHELKNDLNYLASYTLPRNAMEWVDFCLFSQNGILTYYVIAIDLNRFNIEAYIHERETRVSALEVHRNTIPTIERLLNIFPKLKVDAN